MRPRWIAIAAVVSLVLASCATTGSPAPTNPRGSLSSVSSPSPLAALTPSPSPIVGGCGASHVYSGPGPDATLGLGENSWATAMPASSGIVAYFWYPAPNLLFTNGDGSNRTKVLWVSHSEQAKRLTVTAHPVDAAAPIVVIETPAASSPAGNYASSIDLPSPGCWHLDLSLGATRATMDVRVAASSAGASVSPSP